jgi:hypothetical protein
VRASTPGVPLMRTCITSHVPVRMLERSVVLDARRSHAATVHTDVPETAEQTLAIAFYRTWCTFDACSTQSGAPSPASGDIASNAVPSFAASSPAASSGAGPASGAQYGLSIGVPTQPPDPHV